jgi:hypothetical protein
MQIQIAVIAQMVESVPFLLRAILCGPWLISEELNHGTHGIARKRTEESGDGLAGCPRSNLLLHPQILHEKSVNISLLLDL